MVNSLAWMSAAACAGYDPELWFPRRGQGNVAAAALTVCAGCPVRLQCLDFALAYDLGYGIFGGALPSERKALRAERGIRKVSRRLFTRPCGTEAAYRQHLRHGETPCGACRVAQLAASRERWDTRKRRRAAASQKGRDNEPRLPYLAMLLAGTR